MGKASKKIALIESKCDFNIDGMKLFRFHSYSDTDFLSHEEIPDTHENCLSFILCSTGIPLKEKISDRFTDCLRLTAYISDL